MRFAIAALALGGLAAACSSFGEAPSSSPDVADAGQESGTPVGDGAIEASTAFCPVPGALFCSDFEQGDLTKEWLPQATPTKFLTLDVAGDHGHAVRATLDANSHLQGDKEALSRPFARAASITYAFDVRVTQKPSDQHVEIASMRTAEPTSTLAFHIVLDKQDFALAEFSRPSANQYKVQGLRPIDDAWHRFEVRIGFSMPPRLRVSVDGAVLVDRDTALSISAVPAGPLMFTVGVSDIAHVDGPLVYMIDNVTVFAP